MSVIPNRSMPRVLVPTALLLVAACGGTEADAKAKGEAAPPAPTAVSAENLTVVRLEKISSGPALSGSLAAEREATVRAQLSGPVLSTHADQGSRVGAGTLLARIDDRTVRDQFLGARSGVTTAQSAAKRAMAAASSQAAEVKAALTSAAMLSLSGA